MKRNYSVVIPVLNEEKFVGSLLESLTKQTVQPLEIIVVDGNSKDATLKIVKSYEKKLTNLHMLSGEQSQTAQRNMGAKYAKGDWLVFLDADTILYPYFFERIDAFIEEKKPSIMTTWFSPDSDIFGDALITLIGIAILETSIPFKRAVAPGFLTIVKRKAFWRVNGFDEAHMFGEDVDLGIRMTKEGFTLAILRETLFIWSLRRFRQEGTITKLRKFVIAVVSVLVLGRTPHTMPGYDIGGAFYTLKKSRKLSFLKTYEKRLRKVMKELFE